MANVKNVLDTLALPEITDRQITYLERFCFDTSASNQKAALITNHLFKAIRSQLILGSSMKFIGGVLIDPGILLSIKLPVDVIIVRDYTSDTKVLQLVNWSTIDQLLELESDSSRSDQVAILGLTLMFLHLFIDAINSKVMLKKDRLFAVWYSFLWFSSIEGIHKITMTNFTNCVMGLIWIILREDVRSLRLIATEPLEHYFGHIRTWNSEFSTLDFLCFSKKLDQCLDYIFQSNLVSGRGDSEGYLSGFNGLKENVKAMLQKRSGEEKRSSSKDLSAVKIDYNKPAVDQLEKQVLKIINDATEDMMALFGKKSGLKSQSYHLSYGSFQV